jgi:hypothetical protein
MPNGPQRLILIHSGRYDYAEVELRGSLQIVGPNNTGKTTLINTLQFLYLDDRRHMEFGSYTAEHTRDYYFPDQYSYVLFEVLGASGKCVIGWRGQNRVIDPEPERFFFEGPFDRHDFLHEGSQLKDSQVREPKDVSSRLSLKNYRVLKSAQEHRELLLLSTKGEAKGLGLVVLRDNERYHQFRETLKRLLCLSAISQGQMRDQLVMLAGLSTDRHALNIREMFGDDYDRILVQKQKLVRFKKQQKEIELLLAASTRRDAWQGELAYRWRDLLAKRQEFEQNHDKRLEKLTRDAEGASKRIQDLEACVGTHHDAKVRLGEAKGTINTRLGDINKRAKEFEGFAEELARSALKNLQADLHRLEDTLRDAERETHERAERKNQQCREIIDRTNHAIEHFDRALITVLRRHLKEVELASLSRLFNFDLLEQTVGNGGASLRAPAKLIRLLRLLSQRIKNNVYQDENITLPLPSTKRSLSELHDVDSLKERLLEEETSLQKSVNVLAAIQQRDSLLGELNKKRQQVDGKKDIQGREIEEGLAKQLFRFEEYEKIKQDEPRLKAELKRTLDEMVAEEKHIHKAQEQLGIARAEESSASQQIRAEESGFAAQIKLFGDCSAPDTEDATITAEIDLASDFVTSVEQYLTLQQELQQLNSEISTGSQRLEAVLGPDYAGVDEFDTIQHLREELEALPDKEDVLRRDWHHQLTSLQATFDQILRSLADIKSASDRLNRDFSVIQISNLASLRMDVLEQADMVGPMSRLATINQPGLFDDSAGIEATIANFRTRFEAMPFVSYQNLFTLQFTVTGEDGRPHHYDDFRQVESDGTTITIKVLFNLLMLRSLLREDAQKNLFCEVPFFLDEIYSLDAVNRHAILETARKLGFIAITAAPESVSEVDALYFLQPHKGRIVVKNSHRVAVIARKRSA